MDSQDSSLPSTPQDQEKEWSPKKQGSPSRLIKQSVQNDVSMPSIPISSVSKPVTSAVNIAPTDNQAVQSTTDVNEFYEKTDSIVVTVPLNKLYSAAASHSVTSEASVTSPDIPITGVDNSSLQTKVPDGLQSSEQNVPINQIVDQAKRNEDLSCSNEHGQQQRPVVHILSSLQRSYLNEEFSDKLKKLQLTFTGSKPAALQTSTQPVLPPKRRSERILNARRLTSTIPQERLQRRKKQKKSLQDAESSRHPPHCPSRLVQRINIARYVNEQKLAMEELHLLDDASLIMEVKIGV